MNITKIIFLLLCLGFINSCGDSTSAEQTFLKSIQKKWKWERTSWGDLVLQEITPDSIHANYTVDLTEKYTLKLFKNDTLGFSGHYNLRHGPDSLWGGNENDWFMTLDSSEVAKHPVFPPLSGAGEYALVLESNNLVFYDDFQFGYRAHFTVY
jgi:hypothetical protein